MSTYERDRIASSIGSLPSVSTFESEQFDVISYANSHIGSVSQVLSSVSTHTGTTNETYGITRLARCGEGRGISYYLNDGRGSVVQTTNERGRVTSWKRYSSTGSVEASSSLGELSSYGWNAEEQNPLTGLTYLRFRYLDTDTGVFGVADTYLGNVFNPLSLNRYLYCLSDPVNYVDPTGHATKAIFDAASKLASATSSIVSQSAGRAYQAAERANAKNNKTLKSIGKPLGFVRTALRVGKPSSVSWAYAKAQECIMKYYQFYCGGAEKINEFHYDREAAIEYAYKYSFTRQGEDPTQIFWDSVFSSELRSPLYPNLFSANCTNFTSQVLHAGGIPMTDEWHMEPSMIGALLGYFVQRNIQQTWDYTATWTAAQNQYEYFSDKSNGYMNGSVINISRDGMMNFDDAINVPYGQLSESLPSLNIQPGDLMYFYGSDGAVHHATVINDVRDGKIYYSGNSLRRFNMDLGNSINDDSGVLIVRINDDEAQ